MGLQADRKSPFEDLQSCFYCAKGQHESIEGANSRHSVWCNRRGHHQRDHGICNAVKHCTWICEIGQKCGNRSICGEHCALMVGDMHESEQPLPWPFNNIPGYLLPGETNTPRYECMDRFNNNEGIGCIGSGDCLGCCISKVASGHLIVNDFPPGSKYIKPRKRCNAAGRVF